MLSCLVFHSTHLHLPLLLPHSAVGYSSQITTSWESSTLWWRFARSRIHWWVVEWTRVSREIFQALSFEGSCEFYISFYSPPPRSPPKVDRTLQHLISTSVDSGFPILKQSSQSHTTFGFNQVCAGALPFLFREMLHCESISSLKISPSAGVGFVVALQVCESLWRDWMNRAVILSTLWLVLNCWLCLYLGKTLSSGSLEYLILVSNRWFEQGVSATRRYRSFRGFVMQSCWWCLSGGWTVWFRENLKEVYFKLSDA